MKKSLLVFVTIALLTTSSFAQVAINTNGENPDPSAILDLSSDSKGLLIPRMTTDNRTTNITPVAGLLVYDTDTDSFWYYDTQWIELVNGNDLNINGLSDGKTDDKSVFLGTNAGLNDNGNTESTATGIEALKENTTSLANSAFGFNALKANYEGEGNTAVGCYGLLKNGIGDYNTTVGALSLFNNTTGVNNTAQGYQALLYNSTGSNNTAVGYKAGQGASGHNISGGVFIGHEAGQSNTSDNKLFIDNSSTIYPLIGGDFDANRVDINGTIKITGGTPGTDKVLTSDADGLATWETKTYGATELNGLSDAITDGYSVFLGNGVGVNDDGANYNTGVGSQSLNQNTTGRFNSAFGSAALVNNTTGNDNTAIGVSSLYSNTGGSFNTAIGKWVLNYNITGMRNTAVGYEAGKGTTGNSISGCVFFGYEAGKSNTSDNKLFIDNSSTTTPLIGGDFSANEIYLHGDVGIGTASILERLHVTEDNSATDGSDGCFALLQNTNASSNVLSGIRFKNGTYSNTSKGGIFYRDMISFGRGDIVFVNNSTGMSGNATFADARMTIKNDGKVGIGTTDPGTELEVVGQVKITGGTPGANKVLTSDADGLATWETKTYGATELNGLSDGKTDVSSVFLGNDAGSVDDGGNSNTAVGIEALKSNTSGNYNTGIGIRTLYNNSEGNCNTAVGYNAGSGSEIIDVNGCVYLGNSAGSNNEIDNYLFIDNSSTSNPLIGGSFSEDRVEINGTIKITGGTPGSGKVLTSDADGRATWETKTYGATELNELSDAKTNGTSIYIGDEVGANDGTPNYNTAIGANAFKTNTSGVSNTAFGYNTLRFSDGSNNSAFGYGALNNNTTGITNTAIGSSSLRYSQTGNYNTAIGFQAGEGSSGNSISGCVLIGYRAGKTNNSNNKLYITNSDDSTPLIGGDFSSNELYFNATEVGIGTDDPNELLEVAGASGASARMNISDGLGSNRYAILFVSPNATDDFARIDSYKYGTGSGSKALKFNTAGSGGDVIIGGDVVPESHKGMDLGATGNAWDNVYADDYITEGSAAFANINVTKQLISFPPMEKKAGAFDEFTDKGLKELDPASLPKELTEGNALLIDEMTTYNYKANYEQQQQIETLKKENAELKARLDKLEKLINQR